MRNPGYTENKEQLQTRLARIEGQVRGVQRMVEEDRYCIDVLTQISAVHAGLDKVALSLVDGHTRNCIVKSRGAEREEHVGELMGALDRLLAR
jgi:CsoR family transcriptional regulator, copper-sensing transcriptional repressor